MILAFYDIETTGFSREHNDIIEISAIAWDSVKDEVVDKYSSYIKPTTRIPKVITDLTGIENNTVRKYAGYWDIMPEFYAWLKNSKIQKMVGYNNITFDWPFITAQNARYKIEGQEYEQIDALSIVRKLKKQGLIDLSDFCTMRGEKENVKQPTVAAFFGIQYDAHNSANDVQALIEIYKHLRKIDPTLI